MLSPQAYQVLSQKLIGDTVLGKHSGSFYPFPEVALCGDTSPILGSHSHQFKEKPWEGEHRQTQGCPRPNLQPVTTGPPVAKGTV